MSDKPEPPNLRVSATCSGCPESMYLMSDTMCACNKFDMNVRLNYVCDEHPMIKEAKSAKQ